MNNKILVLLYIPIIDKEYSVLLPIGKTMGAIKFYLIDIIASLNELKFVDDMDLYDKETRKKYSDDSLLKDTNIKNGTKLVLL